MALDAMGRYTASRHGISTSSTIERAVGIIEKEMNGGAAFAQIQKATTVTEALAVIVQAEGISVADGKKLTALMQTSSDDDDAGAPDPAVYESQSGGVLDTLNKLLEVRIPSSSLTKR